MEKLIKQLLKRLTIRIKFKQKNILNTNPRQKKRNKNIQRRVNSLLLKFKQINTNRFHNESNSNSNQT